MKEHEETTHIEGLIEEGEAFSRLCVEPDTRLEAFSDGVFAFSLTLLVIDIKVPSAAATSDVAQLWQALGRLAPSAFAFLLSFGVILITWVNHHAALKLVRRSSTSFAYANGFLLLTVVLVPFTTALLGEFILTDHAAPGVVLYEVLLTAQALGWVLVSGVALRGGLTRGESALSRMRENNRNGYFACVLYASLSVTALWFPMMAALVTTATWAFWLVLGIRMREGFHGRGAPGGSTGRSSLPAVCSAQPRPSWAAAPTVTTGEAAAGGAPPSSAHRAARRWRG